MTQQATAPQERQRDGTDRHSEKAATAELLVTQDRPHHQKEPHSESPAKPTAAPKELKEAANDHSLACTAELCDL